ncbi:hypothetical protein OHA40_33925 [Nocardia sp. NBC_00508]|uniref:hypothetical protein n=1 Tax=Nocardia sp. NBC_00508 TaxID=2975992 RepID=UPI002E806B4B|nr:hypothetical protein [Nocardia sp. NBC_00508]WUD66485.1 hypothetical protein OHA40_33925 [Nocardia sp. NBC_00508]
MSQNDANLWRQLAEKARAGELYLDDENAAYLCAKACDKRLDDLVKLLAFARNAQNVSGFGDFKMADDLAKKFVKQATGDPNSIDQVIAEDIETVKNMREVMAISFKRITGQDIENAAAIVNETGQVG